MLGVLLEQLIYIKRAQLDQALSQNPWASNVLQFNFWCPQGELTRAAFYCAKHGDLIVTLPHKVDYKPAPGVTVISFTSSKLENAASLKEATFNNVFFTEVPINDETHGLIKKAIRPGGLLIELGIQRSMRAPKPGATVRSNLKADLLREARLLEITSWLKEEEGKAPREWLNGGRIC